MTGETIMIVEDEGLITLHLIALLKKTGYRVIDPIYSGEMALRVLERSPEPDLILMDIKLAGKLDGIETARKIRQHLPVPLIFVTGYASERMLESMQEVAADRIIFKPFIEEDLLAAVRESLEKRIYNKGAIFKKNGSPDADMDQKSSSGTMIHG
jgi:two-component system, response regulator PdtaR